MTDQALRRTDALLTELVELIETARSLPLSSSIVVPRERVLDLLDELRETMPPEMQEARRTVATRDSLLHDAHADAQRSRESAQAQAHASVAEASGRAVEVLAEAEQHAAEIIEAGRREHDRLVAATDVYQDAQRSAAEANTVAGAQAAAVRERAEHDAKALRSSAEAYAAKLTSDADEYADRSLADLAHRLQRAAAVAEQGRVELARRRAIAEHPTPVGGSGGEPAAAPARISDRVDTEVTEAADVTEVTEAIKEPAEIIEPTDETAGDPAADDPERNLSGRAYPPRS
ncbi:MAG: hypothetical protein M3O28_13875 [Actinomycetota bacterium]|nr:hypothetical protein [Actinomycetota bacterium]